MNPTPTFDLGDASGVQVRIDDIEAVSVHVILEHNGTLRISAGQPYTRTSNTHIVSNLIFAPDVSKKINKYLRSIQFTGQAATSSVGVWCEIEIDRIGVKTRSPFVPVFIDPLMEGMTQASCTVGYTRATSASASASASASVSVSACTCRCALNVYSRPGKGERITPYSFNWRNSHQVVHALVSTGSLQQNKQAHLSQPYGSFVHSHVNVVR